MNSAVSQSKYRAILKEEYDLRSVRNPRYSIRAFAKSLEISASQLCDLLAGKKYLTLGLAEKILPKLDLDEPKQIKFMSSVREVNYLVNHLSQQQIPEENDQSEALFQLHLQYPILLAQWYYYPIVNLAIIEQKSLSPEKVSVRLGLTLEESKKAIQQLESVGLLGKNIHTLKTIPLLNLGIGHEQISKEKYLQYVSQVFAKASEKTIENHQSDYAKVLTFAVNEDYLPLAKSFINRFMIHLSKLVAIGDAKEIYQLGVVFQQLTQSKAEDREA